jgi:hypothetical protein
MAVHKGTELNNVAETWNRNEQLRQNGDVPLTDNASTDATGVSSDLNDTIKEEAAAYDRANKEDRLLDGERATLNDSETA